MGLVRCSDQFGLQVLCVQETQSPPVSSLPVDQPFRYDGPVGSHGREAGFLFHSSIVATPIPGTLSLFVASSQGLSVSAHSARHMLGFRPTLASSSGARSQPQSTASRSSTQALRFFLQGTRTSGFPFSSLVVHDRLMHLFLPTVQEILQSFPGFWDRCGAALDTFSVNPHHCPLGFELLSLAPLCCPLLCSF